MKIILANLLAVIHPIVVFVILFGWFIPGLFYIHGLLLLATLMSWMFFGKCILTVWEYKLRGGTLNYQYGYIQYHVRNIFKKPPTLYFIKVVSLVYVSLSLIIWFTQYYLGQ